MCFFVTSFHVSELLFTRFSKEKGRTMLTETLLFLLITLSELTLMIFQKKIHKWSDFEYFFFPNSLCLCKYKTGKWEINLYSRQFRHFNWTEAPYFKITQNSYWMVRTGNETTKSFLVHLPHSIKGLWNELSLCSSQSSGINRVAHYTSSRSEMRLGECASEG